MATQPNLDQLRQSQFFTDSFQRGLAHWNRERLEPGFPAADWQKTLERDLRMTRLEGGFLEELRAEIVEEAARAPTDPDGFIAWFEELKQVGPGQGDPLFPWLAEEATAEQLKWFFEQEAAGEAGFDDLVAMTQVKLPVEPKLELARNYWDEMGRGNAAGMHGPMLDALSQALDLVPTIDGTIPQALALGNTLVAFATTRRYAYHAIGALGVVELTAPWRAGLVAEGLKRVGVGKERKYFALHATLDVEHSQAWNAEVLRPLVEADPGCARFIAEGALMRLECGRRCFEAYRSALWAPAVVAA